MVVGGYSDHDPKNPGGLTNSVELVSPVYSRVCSVQVKPIFGEKFLLEGTDGYPDIEVNQFAALGMTGQFVNEAPIGKINT